MNHAELCMGMGATSLALGSDPLWYAEIDKHARTVLRTRFPGIPNIGDIKAANWQLIADRTSHLDLLTAGFPCQPVSSAGRRKVHDDDRWIWPYILEAIRVLRPGHVFLENVPGLRRRWKDSQGTWQPNPLAGITADLASCGYVGSWVSVRASDVGAPHLRDRVFVLAHADSERREQRTEPDRPAVRPGLESSRRDDALGLGDLGWWWATPERAEYAPAIERWHRLHRPVPTPVTPEGRLNPLLSEWMMGLPAGWVTDVDIPTTAKHRIIGNGQVPQAVRAALALLTGIEIDTHTHTGRLIPTPRTSDSNGSGSHGDGGADLRTTIATLV